MTRHINPEGFYTLEAMPAQSQLALCHSFFVPVERRGKRLGHRLKANQMETIDAEGYDYAICTVDGKNEAQKQILLKAGWQRIASFPNSKTGGSTEIWGWRVGDATGETKATCNKCRTPDICLNNGRACDDREEEGRPA